MILITDLLRRKADAQGQRFAVSEIFFDAARGALHYVALRTGGFFNREEVLLSIRAFERPEPRRDGWPVALDGEAVAAAPVWTEGTKAGRPLSLTFWPPIVVGPFGNTESPLMLWAQAAEAGGKARGDESASERLEGGTPDASAGATASDEPLGAYQAGGSQASEESTGNLPASGNPDLVGMRSEAGQPDASQPASGGAEAPASPSRAPTGQVPSGRPIGDGRVYRLERVRRRLGAEVFGSDGPLGHLADMVIDTDEFRIDALVVITDRARHRVPYGALRHMASEGDHLVLALDAQGLAATPPAHAPVT